MVTWGSGSSGGDAHIWSGYPYFKTDKNVTAQLSSGIRKIFSTGSDYGGDSGAAFAALKNDGSVVTWGRDFAGGDSSAVASKISSGVVEVFSTALAFAALKSDGSVVTWGHPLRGGDPVVATLNTNSGGYSYSHVTNQISGGVVKIFATQFAFAALKTNGSELS